MNNTATNVVKAKPSARIVVVLPLGIPERFDRLFPHEPYSSVIRRLTLAGLEAAEKAAKGAKS